MLKHLTKVAATAALLATPLAAWAGGHTEFTIRATANSNENDEDYDGLVVFKNYVEQASNGRIAVEMFIGTQLCSNGAECLQGVADGNIDVYISTSGGASGIFPFVQVLDLPYLMSDDRVAEAVLQNGTEFMNTMKQMTLDASGGMIRLVKALGASPTPISWPELFTSFQTGVVEGSKNGITDIMGMKFPDAGLQYVTLDGHAYMGALWFMNNEKFQSMPNDLKRVVIDGFYQLQQATFASPKRKSIDAYAEFQAGGGDLYVPSPEEKQAFKDAAAPVFDWFNANVDGGQAIFDALSASVAAAEADIDAARATDLN